MKPFALTSTLLSLMICAGCTTTKPEVVIKYVTVKEKVPADLIAPVPPAWRKAGGPAKTEDFVVRGDVNESALKVCTAQVDGTRKWNGEP
ncbi:MAG: hypothetical protein EOS47_12680 [Mesorhizobium sp.]|nr:MAG: hypothetical protein EOS47_12680 [Mesorhizobium sp.]TIT43615.1 MAG: hypothetical protein E5W76_06025 [Mesorhizobium sp.]